MYHESCTSIPIQSILNAAACHLSRCRSRSSVNRYGINDSLCSVYLLTVIAKIVCKDKIRNLLNVCNRSNTVTRSVQRFRQRVISRFYQPRRNLWSWGVFGRQVHSLGYNSLRILSRNGNGFCILWHEVLRHGWYYIFSFEVLGMIVTPKLIVYRSCTHINCMFRWWEVEFADCLQKLDNKNIKTTITIFYGTALSLLQTTKKT